MRTLVLFYSLIIPLIIHAQSYITFGDNSSTTYENPPFDGSKPYSRSLALYIDNDHNLKNVTITRLAWNVKVTNSVNSFYITVFMKNTDLGKFSDSPAWDTAYGYTTKYNSFQQSGWDSILLDNVFQRKNLTNNLLIYCGHYGGSLSSGQSLQFQYSYSPGLHAQNSADNKSQLDNLPLGTNGYRPNIRITYISTPDNFASVPSSKSITLNWTSKDNVLILGNTSETFTETTQGDNTFYNGPDKIYSGKGSTYTHNELPPGTKYYYKIYAYYQDEGKYYYSPYDTTQATTDCSITNNIYFENSQQVIDTVCKNETNQQVIFGSPQSGYSYSWLSSIDNLPFTIMNNRIFDTLILKPLFEKTNYKYKRVVSFNNCTDTSNIVTLLVSPLSIGVNINPGSSTICIGTQQKLSLVANIGSVQNWERSVSPSTIWENIGYKDSQDITISESSAGTYEYRAVVKSGVCDPVRSSICTLKVDNKPVITVDGAKPVCDNSDINITINATNSDSLKWTRDQADKISGIPDSGNNSTIIGTVKMFSPSEPSVKVTLTITAYGGCTSTQTASFTVNPVPKQCTIKGYSDVCRKSTVLYYLDNISLNMTYNWEIDPSAAGTIDQIPSPGNVQITWNPKDPLLYTAQLICNQTNTYSCASKDSLNVSISGKSVPDAESLIRKKTADPTVLFLLCQKNTISDGLGYKWGYYKTGYENQPFYDTNYLNKNFCRFKSYDTSLSYFVEEFPLNDSISGCSKRTIYFETSASGPEASVMIYPNPSSGKSVLSISDDTSGEITADVLTLYGVKVIRFIFQKTQQFQEFPLNLNNLSPGIYIFDCNWGNCAQFKSRIIKY